MKCCSSARSGSAPLLPEEKWIHNFSSLSTLSPVSEDTTKNFNQLLLHLSAVLRLSPAPVLPSKSCLSFCFVATSLPSCAKPNTPNTSGRPDSRLLITLAASLSATRIYHCHRVDPDTNVTPSQVRAEGPSCLDGGHRRRRADAQAGILAAGLASCRARKCWYCIQNTKIIEPASKWPLSILAAKLSLTSFFLPTPHDNLSNSGDREKARAAPEPAVPQARRVRV